MFVGSDRHMAQSFFLKLLKGCTFLLCEKHVEDDITRKIADLGLTFIKYELLQHVFGDQQKKERGIINSETTEEFLAKVDSI